ncbi:MAG TPA: thiamine pyrophosphate-dependent enzyme [Candidatus Lustribacter sp.]
MLKQEAIDLLAKHRNGAISVTTMQTAAPWHLGGHTNAFHLEASACMGSASSLGLGLALGTPDRKVVVLDGDGSLLMQLGSLVTIAGHAPRNLYHFVFANGHYESSGNQPLPGNGKSDFVALARAAGYAVALRCSTAEQLDRALPDVFAREGPALIELVVERDDATPRWAGVPMAEMVRKLRADLGVA